MASAPIVTVLWFAVGVAVVLALATGLNAVAWDGALSGQQLLLVAVGAGSPGGAAASLGVDARRRPRT